MLVLDSYIISPEDTIFVALNLIDQNKKGFLIVIDKNGKTIGTLTDGDIRRAFIAGGQINDKVNGHFTTAFTWLHTDDTVTKAIDVFKNESIKFLPICNGEMKLVNIITKVQLHTLLLKDIHADLEYDFFSLDESVIDHEIFQRPWGFYKTTVMNDYCQAKIICVYPKSQLSLQSHDHREEHWIIAHGTGTVQIGESFLEAKCGESYFIPKGCKHRLTNTDDKETLVITEVQIGDYFGEDDIHRYEDVYGRI
jgi:mannose-1-phosphate guanylyltransferase/mannose-6-phosphate isomerase